ncbi:MAG TPA: hypothetical protein VFE62_21435 [Gemmataceae bacterium]|nr:hypothetical protein [Gemmataceae bacterium]
MTTSKLTTRKAGTIWVAAVALALAVTGTLTAQTIPPPPQLDAPVANALATLASPDAPGVDPEVKQASGCSSCGMKPWLGGYGGGGCGPGGCGAGGCGSGSCVPGRICHGCGDRDTVFGRFMGCLYDELCCPDPCYEPTWIPAANAAFFQDGPRPVTQTRIRWDEGVRYRFPDTSEYLWPQIGGKGPKVLTPYTNYAGLSLYQEVAAKGFSFFFELPYLNMDPAIGPGAGGFGDMNLGTKAVLLDRELLLVTMQFRTYIPTGNFQAGLGTGHVSLEPALLAALKLTHSTYLQGEIADWIPIGGTPGFEGNVFHYHASLNQNICHVGDCFNIVGTMEFNGWSFRGAFSDPLTGAPIGIGGSNYVNAGPGFRVQFCERVDFGVGAAFGFGNGHGPTQIYRTEFRLRF